MGIMLAKISKKQPPINDIMNIMIVFYQSTYTFLN